MPLNDEEVRVEVDTRNPSDLFTLDRVLMDSPLCYDDIAVSSCLFSIASPVGFIIITIIIMKNRSLKRALLVGSLDRVLC